MKLISCHHIKKRPPEGGGISGKLIWSTTTSSIHDNDEETAAAAAAAARCFRKDALFNANLIKLKPSASLKCCHLVRCSRSILNFRRVFKKNVSLLYLSLMCLIIISDFQQQLQQLPRLKLIAKKCAQKDLEEIELQYNNNNLALSRTQYTPTNRSTFYQDRARQFRSSIKAAAATTTTETKTTTARRTTTLSINKYQESENNNKYECQESTTKSWSSLINLFLPKNGLVLFANANVDANRLYEDLMMTYNRIVLPVQNNTDRVVVKLALKLSQLIDVNLKNQMMTTNVWLNQEWSDYKLKWDPSEYGGIEDINVPAEQIWLPDIVLYNSAEGYFAVSIMTKAKVRFDGHVTWNPPAIFRSSCQIDIQYFPFDIQFCHLKFGSWTFGTKIDLRHINDTEALVERGTDLSEYYQNVEWDIMKATAKRNVITYQCCPNDFYPDVTFNFELRRKPLFYTVNLIAPCIAITILSFAVFYLPSDSGEKVTLTISILVSLIFFLSVLIETIPSTSLAMPLLGKYLVFTMILITVSVCATVCVLNIHFRTPSTHSMPAWVKRWCIEILPRYLFMNVPQYQSQQSTNPILPEQLIYLHNQAYAAQQQLQLHQNQNHQQQQQQNQNQNEQQRQQQLDDQPELTADINWPSAKVAAEYIKANHSTEFGGHQNSFASASASAATTHALANNNNNKNNNQSNLGEFRQLDVGKLKKFDQKQANAAKAVASIGAASLNISPSSLFLPYLQSEAARRLQMQRSRSSDRDRSTSDHQVSGTNNNNSNNNNNLLPNNTTTATTTLTSTTYNNSCDNNQFSPPSQQPILALLQSNQRNNTNTTIDMQSTVGSTNNNNNNKTKRDSKRKISRSNSTKKSTKNSTQNETNNGSEESQQQQQQIPTISSVLNNNKNNKREKLVKSDKRNFIKRIFIPKRSASIIREESSNSSDVEASRTTTTFEKFVGGTRRRSSNKVGQQTEAGATTAGAAGAINKSNLLQHDTSSSFENDYQYHNHFQARASICSTNIWRVGPSRRCSVAVPTNYPTFYQPALAHIAHSSVTTPQQQQQQQQQQHQQTGNQLSTLSGCVANHNHATTYRDHNQHHHHDHHHNMTPSSDSSDSTQSGAIDALVKATTTKLTVPPRLNINQPSTSDLSLVNHQAAPGNPLSSSMLPNKQITGQTTTDCYSSGQLNSSFINRISQTNLNYNQPLTQQQHLRQPSSLKVSNQHLMANPTPTPPPPPPLPPSPIPKDAHLHACQQDQLQQHRFQSHHNQLILNPANLQQRQQQHIQGQPDHQQQELLILNHGFNPVRQQANNQQATASYRQQQQHHLVGQTNSLNNQSNLHAVSQMRVPSLVTRQHYHQANNNSTLYSTATGQGQQQQIVYRVIPRSRSTDYRLCLHAGESILSTSNDDEYYPHQAASRDINDQADLLRNQQQFATGGGVGGSRAGMFQSDQQTFKGVFNVMRQNKSVTNQQQQVGDSYLLQGPHTIGRALGQAYMQRLQRQPAIYSMHSSSSNNQTQNRPSRSLHRSYLKPLGDLHQQQQQHESQFGTQLRYQSTLVDNIRRSKSQTSLNRRAGQVDCDQCKIDQQQPWLINSEQTRRAGAQVCSYDLSREQQHQQQNQTGRSLKCQLISQEGCCSGNNHHGGQPLCCSSVEHFRPCYESNCKNNNLRSGLNQCNLSGLDSVQRRQFSDPSNRLQPLNTLGLMKLIADVDKAIQNAMFIAQHIDNLDEFESVKENWKYIAMVIDRIFLIVFLFACIVGTVTIFAMVPWSYYTTQKPIDLRLTRLMALNLTNASGILMGEDPYSRSCRDF